MYLCVWSVHCGRGCYIFYNYCMASIESPCWLMSDGRPCDMSFCLYRIVNVQVLGMRVCMNVALYSWCVSNVTLTMAIPSTQALQSETVVGLNCKVVQMLY